MTAPDPTPQDASRRRKKAFILAGVSLLLGLIVGAVGGKPLIFLYFTFWFITIGATVLTLGILFWMMVLSRRLRFFAFNAMVDVLVFHVGMVFGLFLVGA